MVRVAGLLADIERLVDRIEDERITTLYEHYSPEWRRSVLMPNGNWSAAKGELVDAGALASLGALSSLLSVLGSEGSAPDGETLGALRESLDEALGAVRGDQTLPPEIKRLLVARLHDMLWAIDHLNVMGPEGVKAAAERLAGAVAVDPALRDHHPAVAKVLTVAGRIWSAFTFAGQVTEAIEGWETVATRLIGN